ncbi:ubiquinol oxidase subunit II [Novosphingobium sp. FSY-8]|uniref:Ubiquinol oxidase polypeptide II n=1 Tax=Novosphingobium ovatum TaxID=1908523 RepID=A0ABW9XCE6_9SPHN|nr:ubiquinol oxidase subunit II [Novosphingobium ovatum]NBC36205.1 ubiquinol oxidase subunit II [Novosphingobium ovatum]
MQPSPITPLRRVARYGAIASLFALTACNPVVLHPAGDIAQQQAHLVVVATVLMLLIIVPVMALTVLFAWRYRAGNQDATYDPEWHHSTQLELVIWSAPLLIIIALGSVTWVGTHMLDPFRPLDRIAEGKPIPAGTKPLDIQVVALDWKWLFIYPEQKIATVNELALPVDRPVTFHITSSTVMNSFYVPALAGQIYAMPGMTSKLHAVLNKEGEYTGFSANYSGSGFSQMRFKTLGLNAADFDKWADGVRSSKGGTLDTANYMQLEQPTVADPVRRYAAVSADLFDKIVNLCVRPGKMCLSEMMAIDAKGGLGKEGAYNVAALTYDKYGRESVNPLIAGRDLPRDGRSRAYVRELCAVPTLLQAPAPAKGKLTMAAPVRPTPLS